MPFLRKVSQEHSAGCKQSINRVTASAKRGAAGCGAPA
jgi:hypothetical protein